ncbi:hypothetical protein [Streptomyces rubiginosohelvolus]|uniref:hypothetical protein n=2 Tax=Streptomyces TaxID=1883 RepID=UPI0035D73CB8|nr:hypothetical protein OG475_14140 [Streptomyces rubiginosohelvolus]
MDAGLAAVIAGASGAGGAALAAFGTSFAMLRQAKMQRDSAHRLWLHNHQQQAFEELLMAVRRLKDFLASPNLALATLRPEAAPNDLGPYTEELQSLSAAVAAGVTRVSLLADLELGSLAFTLGSAMGDLTRAEARKRGSLPTAPTDEALAQLWDAAHTASGNFTLKAQQTLQKV